MTTLREAAQQALEALDSIDAPLNLKEINKINKASNALRAALEATGKDSLQVEPVAWMYEWDGKKHLTFTDQRFVEKAHPHFNKSTPLYTHPPKREWQSLTDEEIKNIWCWDEYLHSYQQQMIEDIEAKLKEKNA